MTFTSHVHAFLNLRASRTSGAALELPHFSSFGRNITRRLRGSTTVVIDCGTKLLVLQAAEDCEQTLCTDRARATAAIMHRSSSTDTERCSKGTLTTTRQASLS
jgi:hypothetical protein